MIQESRVEVVETQIGRLPQTATSPYAAQSGIVPAAVARLSWGALIAGSVVAMAVQSLLVVLGLAIGLSLAPVTAGEGLAVMAGIWWLITALVSLFIGGYVAGRFSYIRHPFHSAMHGIMTWCLATAVSIVLIGWLGGVVAAGPMSGIVEELVHVRADQSQMQIGVDVPERVGLQVDGQQATNEQQSDQSDLGATAAAWWTFFALLLGVAAAGFGGYLASPANLRETTGGVGGAMRHGNEPE